MYQLSQSDLMTYLQVPIHFWAKVHGHYQPNGYRSFHAQTHLRQLATEYTQQILLPNFVEAQLETQVKVATARTKAKIDAIITDSNHKHSIVAFSAVTSPNRRLIQQLAFQKIIFQKTQSVERAFLVLLNPRYLRDSALSVEKLFHVHEVTRSLNKEVTYLSDKIEAALRVEQVSNPMELHSCVRPETCPCPHLCHPGMPEYSIYDVNGLKTRDTIELRNKGITRLIDIPLEYLHDDRQLEQRSLTKSKSSRVDAAAVKSQLQSLVYPIHFLDYEAFGFPIPLYQGYWPQSSVVFQYSLHTLHKSGELEHKEFLHLESSDPSEVVIQALKNDLPEVGSIVVWDKTLEASVHQHLARLRTKHMLFLLDLNQRLFDLQTVFASGAYADYRFKGSLSLKKILPVFAPEDNHLDLTVSNGLEAANRWYQLIYEPETVENKDKLIQDLKEYCALDTLGCVKILQELQKLH